MPRQHGVRRTCQCNVSLNDLSAHSFVPSLLPQLLELVVKIEHQDRTFETACRPAGAGVQSNDKESFLAKTQREMGVRGIAANTRIVKLTEPRILIGEAFRTCPEESLKRLFVKINRALKNDGKALKQGSIPSIRLHYASDAVVNAPVVPIRSYVAGDQNLEGAFSQGGFRAKARELSLLDQISETIGDWATSCVLRSGAH